jgi:putative flippase GtrA
VIDRRNLRPAGLVRELGAFGVVGLAALAVDVGSFNVLRGPVGLGPLTSKVGSVVLATTVAYAGNRWWTYRHRERGAMSREYSLFFLFNGVGLGIALTCLAVSHYLLGFRSALADNVAANVVGLVLGTAFRFWSYRRFVFVEPAGVPETDDEPTRVLAGVAGSAHD